MLKIIGLLLGLLCLSFGILAQEYKQKPYTFSKLTQESVKITAELNEVNQKYWGDTLISIYKGSSLETIYFNIGDYCRWSLDENYVEDGLYLNKQYFKFYRDTQKRTYQKTATIQRVFEFEYLGKKYVCFIVANDTNSFSYNIFDITSPEKITQFTLSSNKIGSDSFGDFNFDGAIDFVSIIDYVIEGFTPQNSETVFKAMAYTFHNGKTQVLENEETKQAHYTIGIGNNQNIDSFMVFSQDWFFPLKSPNKFNRDYGNYPSHTGGWNEDTKSLYTVEGLRVEPKSYSIVVAICNDDVEAKEIIKVLSAQKINGNYVEVYIKMEIIKRETKWLVLAGNYIERKIAKMAYKELEKKGYKNMIIKDLR